MTSPRRSTVPDLRVDRCNERPLRESGSYVLYWMTANRRVRSNFALQRAIDWARGLDRPLVVLEALGCGHRWASDRLHRFVLDGMADNAASLKSGPVLYYPYLERHPGDGRGLLAEVARRAVVVVTDDFPSFFLPRMVDRAAAGLDVLMERVDSNGLLPLRATRRVFSSAFSFRAFLQKELPDHLAQVPRATPLRGVRIPRIDRLPAVVSRRWPAVPLGKEGDLLAGLPIDHDVAPVPYRGGERQARKTLGAFLDRKLERYGTDRNQPDEEVTSGLSPYLHFGHMSAHETFAALSEREGWSIDRLGPSRGGRREGWWRMRPEAEGFLDELVTWRELGYNMSSKRDDHDRYDSLPHWARETLEIHRSDPREHLYGIDRLEQADTHDPLWNAAQTQLRREGRIHNYLRMLWGKKILEWTPSAEDALEILVELNNKYAVDGRNPNSYSGIFWVLGRYDRPWGPERPIFGKIRYMSSQNTARKVRVRGYIARYESGSRQMDLL